MEFHALTLLGRAKAIVNNAEDPVFTSSDGLEIEAQYQAHNRRIEGRRFF
jgi:hypothetical protein